MADHKIGRMDLWEAFFERANPGTYRVLVHCKDKPACGVSLTTRVFRIRQVETVPSSYCKDLVSPMVQLLREALTESISPGDKFAFLSETTLPVKTFRQVYAALTEDRNSDICVTGEDSWKRTNVGSERVVLVKHRQWAVLNTDHARTMVKEWPGVRREEELGALRFPVWSGNGTSAKTWHETSRGDGQCSDEWVLFATLYGAIPDSGQRSVVGLPGFGGGSLLLNGQAREPEVQGVCRTFTYWRSHSPRDGLFVGNLLSDAPATQLSCAVPWADARCEGCARECDGTHPAAFRAISDHGLQVLRGSPYLFARKFQGGVVTTEQFRRLILGEHDRRFYGLPPARMPS